MAYKITEECISCGACEPECKNEAITGSSHKSVLRSALWIVAFLTLITRKHGSNYWKSGASYIPVRLRLPAKEPIKRLPGGCSKT